MPTINFTCLNEECEAQHELSIEVLSHGTPGYGPTLEEPGYPGDPPEWEFDTTDIKCDCHIIYTVDFLTSYKPLLEQANKKVDEYVEDTLDSIEEERAERIMEERRNGDHLW